MVSNRDLFLDKVSHDLVISKYDLSIVDGIDSTAQRLKVRLKNFFQEWFLDLDAGVPYYQFFLEKQPDFAVIEALTKTAIRTTPKVIEILSFELDFDPLSRNLFINFSVSTEDGVINSNLVLP